MTPDVLDVSGSVLRYDAPFGNEVGMLNQAQIEAALQKVTVPYLNRTLMDSGCLQKIEIESHQVTLALQWGFPLPSADVDSLAQSLESILDTAVVIQSTLHIRAHQCQPHVPLINNVKNVIAISSGKGGVGKSTTAVNIALALAASGARVGLLDADIYGPNQPHMLGIDQQPEVIDDRVMVPIERYGLQTISFGNLIDAQTPAIWRGPMVTKALQQLVFQTRWDALDYLIIDMPPGTGDIQLTLSKRVPVSGAVVVTTPQDIALLDARKGLEMFHKVDVNLLGIIENMSHFNCPHCHQDTPLFGDKGGERLAEDTGVPVVGRVPLALTIRQAADGGQPTVIAEPESALAKNYRDIALTIAARLSLTPKVPVLGEQLEE